MTGTPPLSRIFYADAADAPRVGASRRDRPRSHARARIDRLRAQDVRHLRGRGLPRLDTLPLLHRLDDGVGELVGVGGAADIACAHLAVGVDLEHRLLDTVGGLALAEVAEHEYGRLEQ